MFDRTFQNPSLQCILYSGDCLSRADLPWMNQSIWLRVRRGRSRERDGEKKGERRLWAIWAEEAGGWFIIRVNVCSIPPLFWWWLHCIERRLCCCELNLNLEAPHIFQRLALRIYGFLHLRESKDLKKDFLYMKAKKNLGLCISSLIINIWMVWQTMTHVKIRSNLFVRHVK